MKAALITGGSSGIGEATAKELAKRGWQVAVMARSRIPTKFLSLQGDVAEDSDCRRVAKAVLDKWGRIDALVNCAGTTKFVKHADLEGLSAEDWLAILRVNLVGPWQMIRACSAALNTMSFSLARALAPEVRVNIVSPGFVNTPWQVAAHGPEGAAQAESRFAAVAPLKAAAEPEDIADAIVWLLEGARRVTGEIIYVDGGMHIASPRADPR